MEERFEEVLTLEQACEFSGDGGLISSGVGDGKGPDYPVMMGDALEWAEVVHPVESVPQGAVKVRRQMDFCVVSSWRDVDRNSRPACRGIITTAQRRFLVLRLDDVNRSYDKRMILANEDHPDPLWPCVPDKDQINAAGGVETDVAVVVEESAGRSRSAFRPVGQL